MKLTKLGSGAGALLAIVMCVAFVFGAAPAPPAVKADDVVPYLMDISVLVKVKDGTGSGVIYTKGEQNFVWTAGHVTEGHEVVTERIDPRTGKKRVYVRYSDCLVIKERVQNGRKVGETHYFAEIIRHSSPKGGYDLALLRLRERGVTKASAHFLPPKLIPKTGDPLWHVGSTSGLQGMNHLTQGVFSHAGRLRSHFRATDLDSPRTYDQVAVPAMPGSSGCGVFLKSNGNLVGILTEGPTETLNYVVPARKVYEYAKEVNCLWAVDDTVPVPDDETIFKTPINHIGVAVGTTKAAVDGLEGDRRPARWRFLEGGIFWPKGL